ncbi:MAG: AbrB/MazE/SpoVT family DNA-binding domain-containing protein [Gemmatimonadaceae bacterium]|nr:AbrB/MazE/SpoVT family DNA-binding domain-containing protein [Acetobacteraceae bacterium]
MPAPREVSLFRNGRNQAVRIPVEFELPGTRALMRLDGDRLIIEPMRTDGLLEWVVNRQPVDDEFPDFDEGLLPARDIDLLEPASRCWTRTSRPT